MANFRYRKRSKQTAGNRELDYTQRFLVASTYRFMRNFLERHQGHLNDDSFFAPVAERVDSDSLYKILKTSATPSLQRILLKLKKEEKANLFMENPTELMHKLWEHPKSNQKFRTALGKYLDDELSILQDSLQRDPAPEAKRFQELGGFFKLSEFECDLLLLRRLAEGFWSCDDWGGSITYGKFNRISCALGVSEAELRRMTKPDGRLRKLQCLDGDLNFNFDLLPYLCGADDTPLEENYFARYNGELLPWDFFGDLAEKHGAVLSALLLNKNRTDGLHILFYGVPGTGKTSFAAAVAEKLDRTAYFIKQDVRNRLSAIQICELQRDRDSSLVVIDEADKLLDCAEMNFLGLRRTNGDKGELNAVLDSVKTPCIWITNTPADSLDASSRRRFDYSIEFKPLTADNRERIWSNAAAKHNIKLAAETVTALATRYPVSAGGIELALRNCSILEGESVEEKIQKIMTPHCELMRSPIDKTSEIAREYILDGLNIKGDLILPEIIEAVRNYFAVSANDLDKPRMNLLLSGPPGTGKTEFVKYLGKQLAVPVITKMASDIFSKWVGDTEKNIAAAFDEAEDSRAILFFDEIDGLLQNRERAHRNWEVTQVNELLHRMENFSGVMIGATNFIHNLDPATARRFTFKLEFDYLDDGGKQIFFERMFHTKLNSEESKRLATITNLAPGDFRTARQSLFYLGKEIDNDRRLAALEREAATKGSSAQKMGF
ncbi:MAG: AAA family ATPase [Victivallaceae bacterium]|nr:AAA family ATPase [Victivallaceae bacterium]